MKTSFAELVLGEDTPMTNKPEKALEFRPKDGISNFVPDPVILIV